MDRKVLARANEINSEISHCEQQIKFWENVEDIIEVKIQTRNLDHKEDEKESFETMIDTGILNVDAIKESAIHQWQGIKQGYEKELEAL